MANLEGYVEVDERIRRFYETYPDGRLVTAGYDVVRFQEGEVPEEISVTARGEAKQVSRVFLVVRALAYRTADDPHPAVGHAQERLPGRTPYTFEAELQNGETSAWGRAIAATGLLEPGEGIASANEVRGRGTSPGDRPATDKQKEWLSERKRKQHGVSEEDFAGMLASIGLSSIDDLRFNQVDALVQMLQTGQWQGEYQSDVPADTTGLGEYP